MAQRKRSRRSTRTSGVSSEQTHAISRRDRIGVAWSGVTFVLIAAAGLQWAPSLYVLWIVLLIFGAATIPQVMIWWIAERTRRRLRTAAGLGGNATPHAQATQAGRPEERPLPWTIPCGFLPAPGRAGRAQARRSFQLRVGVTAPSIRRIFGVTAPSTGSTGTP